MSAIEFDDVSKRFGDGTEAIRHASFRIEDGELFVLVGPSGCGKSTLLNLLVGLEDISGGRILVDDRVVNDVDPKDRNMAMVFQSYALYPHMSVHDNIAFPLRLAGMPAAEIGRRVRETAELLELTALLERAPSTLSGGQRQRVAMGRALVRRPRAFLLDEPLSNLDARLRAQMRLEIARLQRRLGTTTVYVTHDQTEAMTLGSRIAVIHQGRIQQIGTPETLYANPRNVFVAGFLGSPAMNLLPARLQGLRLITPMTTAMLADAPVADDRDRTVVAGIRPEHLLPADAIRPDVAASPPFRLRVDLVERLGAETYVHLVVPADVPGCDARAAGVAATPAGSGAALLTARLEGDRRIRAGDPLELVIDLGRLHLFDADSGEAIARP